MARWPGAPPLPARLPPASPAPPSWLPRALARRGVGDAASWGSIPARASPATGWSSASTAGRRTSRTARSAPPGERPSPAARWPICSASCTEVIASTPPDVPAVEQVFVLGERCARRSCWARPGARSLATLGPRGSPVHEYAPARIKQAVTGSGRAEKLQVQRDGGAAAGPRAPAPAADAADALAAAICHAQAGRLGTLGVRVRARRPRRAYRAARAGCHVVRRRVAVIAWLEGVLREKAPTRVVVDVGGVGYERARPALDVRGAARRGQDGRAARPHSRARGRAPAVRLRERLRERRSSSCCCARAASVRSSPRRSSRAWRRSGWWRRCATATVAAEGHPGRGGEDRRAHRRRAARSRGGAGLPGPRRAARAGLSESDALRDQLLSALVNLGYPRSQAERVVETAVEESGEGATIEALIRVALRSLAR